MIRPSDSYVAASAAAAGYPTNQSGPPHQQNRQIICGEQQSQQQQQQRKHQDLNKMQPRQQQQAMYRNPNPQQQTASAGNNPRGHIINPRIQPQMMYSSQQFTNQYAPPATQYTQLPIQSINYFPQIYYSGTIMNTAPMHSGQAGGRIGTNVTTVGNTVNNSGGGQQQTQMSLNQAQQPQQILMSSGGPTTLMHQQQITSAQNLSGLHQGVPIVSVPMDTGPKQQQQHILFQKAHLQPPQQRRQRAKPRKHAIAIIDPNTSKNILEDLEFSVKEKTNEEKLPVTVNITSDTSKKSSAIKIVAPASSSNLNEVEQIQCESKDEMDHTISIDNNILVTEDIAVVTNIITSNIDAFNNNIKEVNEPVEIENIEPISITTNLTLNEKTEDISNIETESDVISENKLDNVQSDTSFNSVEPEPVVTEIVPITEVVESSSDIEIKSNDTIIDPNHANSSDNTNVIIEPDLNPTTPDNSEVVEESVSVESSTESTINYKEGQWSPQNKDGSRQYDRSQLLQLRESVWSQKKPNNINKKTAQSILMDPTQRLQQSYNYGNLVNSSGNALQSSLMPSFANRNNNKRGHSMGGNQSNSGSTTNLMQQQQFDNNYLKRSSMSGPLNPKSNAKGSKSNIIQISLSLREDIKLNESENAWRPKHLLQADLPPEQRETEEIKRKVRGILNKLTPEKFDDLVDQIINLQIDTPEKINEVMILVFEKAIDEPNFSASYARLCLKLAEIRVKDDKTKDSSASAAKKQTTPVFRSALLDKTEYEFRSNVTNREAKEVKLQPILDKIKESTDPQQKLELEANLEEEERKIRRRSGGTVRFIGELFKISMLTGNIMRACIDNLLQATSEDKLECLCKLLTTVGQKFEQTPISNKNRPSAPTAQVRFYNLDEIIDKLQKIADRKIGDIRISSRIRFMIQDVIDLRKNKWVTSKQDVPKTMEQIQIEAKNEQITNQYLNYNLGGSGNLGNSAKKDDFKRFDQQNQQYGNSSQNRNQSSSGGSNNNSLYNRGGRANQQNQNEQNSQNSQNSNSSNNNMNKDGWYTQTGKGPKTVDTNKLGQMLNYDVDTTATKLGSSSQFLWNRSTGNTDSIQQSTSSSITSNPYAPLSGLDANKNSNSGSNLSLNQSGGGNYRNKGGNYNKGSLERDAYGDRLSGFRRNNNAGNVLKSSSSFSSRQNSNNSTTKTDSNSAGNTPSSSRSHSKSTLSSATTSPTPQQQQHQLARNSPIMFDELDNGDEKLLLNHLSEIINDTSFEGQMDDVIPIIKNIDNNKIWGLFYVMFCEYLLLQKTQFVQRKRAADLTEYLLKKKLVKLEHILYGYKKFTEIVYEIVIDVPGAWQDIFEYVGPLIYKKIINVQDLWNQDLIDTKQGEKFLKHFILYCTKEIGGNFIRNYWHQSKLKWSTFVDQNDVESFIKKNKFEFVESKDVPIKIPNEIIGQPDHKKILSRVKELLYEKANLDLIFDYLSTNILKVDKQFVRGLTTLLCDYSIILNNGNYKLDEKAFQQISIPLLQRYIDINTNPDHELELECLHAIQLLIYSIEHPTGVLNSIFYALYDNDVIIKDTFIKWKESKEEPAGKGVSVKGLNNFFDVLDKEEISDENN